jgi:hypothetical protein
MNRGAMSRHLEARFEIAGWDETPFDDGDEVSKLTEALVAKKYSGDVEGTSTTKWLMAYAPDKTATYIGIERIKGTVGGKRGSLVLLHDGSFQDGVATATLRVVSGTDELTAASGSGKFRADPAGSVSLDLDGV